MNVRFSSVAALLLALEFCVVSAAKALAQGSLIPQGPPGPTMLSLNQIEPRTPISSAPFVITTPGSYYLTANLGVSSGDAIDINVSGVTLDLKGFTLSSTEANPTGTAIMLGGGIQNVRIFNGNITGNVTYSGSNYTGSGFAYGIYCSANNAAPVNVRVSGLGVYGCQYDGINLSGGGGAVVESCTVNTVGGSGVLADTVANSLAYYCGNYGIFAFTAINSAAFSTGTSPGLYATICAQNCDGQSSGGIGLRTTVAENCYGSSTANTGLSANNSAQNCYGSSRTGTGLTTFSAENCYGSSTSGQGLIANNAQNCQGSSGGSGVSGIGLFAGYSAINCYGSSINGVGLTANTAENCSGQSSTSTGLSVTISTLNCSGVSKSGNGLFGGLAAMNCYGVTGTGIGLSAQNANFCFGLCYGTGGTNVYITQNKYNMP